MESEIRGGTRKKSVEGFILSAGQGLHPTALLALSPLPLLRKSGSASVPRVKQGVDHGVQWFPIVTGVGEGARCGGRFAPCGVGHQCSTACTRIVMKFTLACMHDGPKFKVLWRGGRLVPRHALRTLRARAGHCTAHRAFCPPPHLTPLFPHGHAHFHGAPMTNAGNPTHAGGLCGADQKFPPVLSFLPFPAMVCLCIPPPRGTLLRWHPRSIALPGIHP